MPGAFFTLGILHRPAKRQLRRSQAARFASSWRVYLARRNRFDRKRV